eukprot:3828444-Karenia_brevis.AAC.1
MTGAIAPSRQDEYCSGTSATLASVMESNTDVQRPYRLPLTKHTHNTECTVTKCVSTDTALLKKPVQKSPEDANTYHRIFWRLHFQSAATGSL